MLIARLEFLFAPAELTIGQLLSPLGHHQMTEDSMFKKGLMAIAGAVASNRVMAADGPRPIDGRCGVALPNDGASAFEIRSL